MGADGGTDIGEFLLPASKVFLVIGFAQQPYHLLLGGFAPDDDRQLFGGDALP